MLHPTKPLKEKIRAKKKPEITRAETIEKLIALLKSDNLNYRWKAAEILGNIHATEAVEPLIESLSDAVSYTHLTLPTN